jgi:O6-methylguanine-DNA--protein-cysteine methyltransferase
METDRKWIVVRVDGKLAGISQDYDRLAEISAYIAQRYNAEEKRRSAKTKKSAAKSIRKNTEQQGASLPYGEITAKAVCLEDILEMRKHTRWEDLLLLGTDFQKRVWKKLWDLTGNQNKNDREHNTEYTKLLSYSDFAELCQNRAGVRPVAHAIALNPLPIVIPCHLVVPKEAIDRIKEIQHKAESTIFKGEDLCQTSILNDNAIDFGEYALGKHLKRRLISMDVE